MGLVSTKDVVLAQSSVLLTTFHSKSMSADQKVLGIGMFRHFDIIPFLYTRDVQRVWRLKLYLPEIEMNNEGNISSESSS